MSITREQISFYSSMFPGRSSAREIIQCAADFHVGGMELMNFCEELKTPDLAVAKELGALARSHGLALPCFSVGIDIIADPENAVEQLFGYARICAELGIPYLHHTIALNFSDPCFTEEIQAQRFRLGAECALKVCDYANSLGVRTLIEDQGFVFNGVENCLRLHHLSQEKIGFVVDVGNIMFYDEKPEDFILAAGSQVCHAHIKDYHLLPGHQDGADGYRTWRGNTLQNAEIGTGSIDFEKVFSAFEKIGYQGMYALEFSGVKDMNEVERVIQFLLRH